MIKNYFKIAWRNLLKNKSYTIIFFIAINSILLIHCSNPNKLIKLENNISTKNIILKKVDSKKVDDFVHEKMKKANIPGISIAVVHRGNIIYKKCYGLANLEHSIPVISQSPFKIASLTKPITAIAIMQLVEKGEVSLDENVSYYLDYLPKE